MRKKYLIISIIIAGILFSLMYVQIYVIRGGAGGVLYWNSNEGLMFIGENLEGAHMSPLRYALESFLVSWGDVRSRDDLSCTRIVVIRVTDKDVKTYVTDLPKYSGEHEGCIFDFQLFEGQIYALSWPKMLRWSGSQFERPTAEEYGAYATAMIRQKTQYFDPHPWEFDNKDGWSMRQFGATPHDSPIVLNSQPMTITFHGKSWPPKPLSVDLVRDGQQLQTLWTFDPGPRPVSKSQYYASFLRH
jgi:hypothetical protein